MIKNELEYKVTTNWVERMSRAIAMLEQDEHKKKTQPLDWQIHYDGVTSQREDLASQVAEYEALIAHDPNKPVILEIESLDCLSDLLIKARIAFKITHQELAVLCQRTEDEVKAFENKNYNHASVLDFKTVLDIFGIKLIDGKFVAQIDDFYKQELMKIRQNVALDSKVKAAS